VRLEGAAPGWERKKRRVVIASNVPLSRATPARTAERAMMYERGMRREMFT
jgi:hypothetical protein